MSVIPEGGDILDEDILPPDLLPETGDIPSEICEHGTDLKPPDLQPETSAILGGSTCTSPTPPNNLLRFSLKVVRFLTMERKLQRLCLHLL